MSNGPEEAATVTQPFLRRRATMPLMAFAFLLSACGSAVPSSQEASVQPSSPPASQPSASETSLPTPAPSGFAFSDEAVLGYYESRGFICDEVQPSATAAGYFFQGCQKQDADGRTLAIGLVTDPSGDLADAYASVQGSADEPILEPTAALDHLSGFLGAMLGDVRGSSLLEWLAGHLGDAYAQTTVDTLTVATYTQSKTDHSRLYVELANQDYIGAPVPSAS
jgi:hypothetical protein